MAERIIDLRLGEPVPEGWRIVQLLDTRTETRGVVPETIRIHTVLITDAKWIPSDYLGMPYQPVQVGGPYWQEFEYPWWRVTC